MGRKMFLLAIVALLAGTALAVSACGPTGAGSATNPPSGAAGAGGGTGVKPVMYDFYTDS
jgi:hypothetical protein